MDKLVAALTEWHPLPRSVVIGAAAAFCGATPIAALFYMLGQYRGGVTDMILFVTIWGGVLLGPLTARWRRIGAAIAVIVIVASGVLIEVMNLWMVGWQIRYPWDLLTGLLTLPLCGVASLLVHSRFRSPFDKIDALPPHLAPRRRS